VGLESRVVGYVVAFSRGGRNCSAIALRGWKSFLGRVDGLGIRVGTKAEVLLAVAPGNLVHDCV
jgi:hypothetical protein